MNTISLRKPMAKSREFNTHYKRFISFVRAPPSLKAIASALSSAGYYYTPQKHIQCYKCAVTITYIRDRKNLLLQHTQLSPACSFIKQLPQSNRTRSLTTLSTNIQAKLIAQDFFQAVYRLKHYLTFPYITIADITIDQDANEHWHLNLHKSIKTSYKVAKNRAHLLLSKAQFKFDMVTCPTAKSPKEWFIHTKTVKHWNTFQHLSEKEINKSLTETWHSLDRLDQSRYNRMALVDTKRCTAHRIENFFRYQGLAIGALALTPQNIIVVPIQEELSLVRCSVLLFNKLSRMVMEE